MRAVRARSLLRRAPLLLLAVAVPAVAACGGGEAPPDESAEPAPAREAAANGSDTEPSPEAGGDDTLGNSRITVSGSHEAEISGGGTFAAARGDLILDFRTPDADRVLTIQGLQAFDGDPREGVFEIGREQRGQPGWDATFVDRAEQPPLTVLAREGTLTLTDVTPERIDGEATLVATAPAGADEVQIEVAFSAVCKTVSGPGACW